MVIMGMSTNDQTDAFRCVHAYSIEIIKNDVPTTSLINTRVNRNPVVVSQMYNNGLTLPRSKYGDFDRFEAGVVNGD